MPALRRHCHHRVEPPHYPGLPDVPLSHLPEDVQRAHRLFLPNAPKRQKFLQVTSPALLAPCCETRAKTAAACGRSTLRTRPQLGLKQGRWSRSGVHIPLPESSCSWSVEELASCTREVTQNEEHSPNRHVLLPFRGVGH